MSGDAIMNPLLRPMSFALLNLSNAVHGFALGSATGEASVLFIIFDLIYFLILALLFKRLVLIILRYIKDKKSKKTVNKINLSELFKGKIFIIIAVLLFLLVTTDSIFYIISMKTLHKNKPVQNSFQPTTYESNDFAPANLLNIPKKK